MPERIIKILNVMDVPSTTPERMGKFDRMFVYMIGAEGSFITTIHRELLEGKTEAEQMKIIKEQILKERGEIARWVGKEIPV